MSLMQDGGLVETVNQLLHFPEELEKFAHASRSRLHHHHEERKDSAATIPLDILQTSKEYIFYLDVPGFSKSDVQVTVEDEKTLVLKGQAKRKREGDEKECKYVRMERKASPRFMRKFNLPEDSDVSSISAKCENGVLSVTLARVPPASKRKTVQIPVV